MSEDKKTAGQDMSPEEMEQTAGGGVPLSMCPKCGKYGFQDYGAFGGLCLNCGYSVTVH